MDINSLPVLEIDPSEEALVEIVDRAEILYREKSRREICYVLGVYKGDIWLANDVVKVNDKLMGIVEEMYGRKDLNSILEYRSLGLHD